MSLPVFFTQTPTPKLHLTPSPKSSECMLEYLNEGGANFVYRISPSSTTPSLPSQLSGKLLRLRKDLPHVQSAKEQLDAFELYFRPLFSRDNLIEHSVIELDSSLPPAINQNLLKLARASHRLQDFIPANETHALLITDMTPHPASTLLQLKPKWLAQSPNAPGNSKRCRTCALRAQRASRSVRTATDKQETCPLELISRDEAGRRRAAGAVTGDGGVREFLVRDAQPLLNRLREAQCSLDPEGVLALPSSTSNSDTDTTDDAVLTLCKAMTLRDCTLFILHSSPDDKIVARLADLDLKLPEKLEKWKSVEEELVREGWYANLEDGEVWREEGICVLGRV